ncbi:unnamed protein product [Cochlearia groenlandica]
MSYIIILILFLIPSFVISADELHERCRGSFTCGDQTDLFYPFWIPTREGCGHPDFMLDCSGGYAEFNVSSVKFRILSINDDSAIIRLARSDYIDNLCPSNPINAPFDQSVIQFAVGTDLLTLYYGCSYVLEPGSAGSYFGDLSCGYDSSLRRSYYVTRSLSSPLLGGIRDSLNRFPTICNRNVSIPVTRQALDIMEGTPNLDNLEKALDGGFELGVNRECSRCLRSGGACGYNQNSSSFICYCVDHPHSSICGNNGIWFASGLVAVILIACGLFYVIRWRIKISNNPSQQNHKALIPLKHYNYTQVKRITNSFAEVVGKGGFGIVYKGTLCDGRNVAVKVLKDSKGNGEDFINEIASMSQTSHVNIVTLLGFCSEGSKRAILYEFLENGSLDKFISNKTSIDMDWLALYRIAIGVARGLQYLHYGCKTRIVHFDIKPHNVLLDRDLCPKVSDFGLAKLCEKKESILSLLDTRGTIGYIAPELFSRMYGSVSHKSDVYSFGMLVLEMIGARNKERDIQNSASNPSSMYFPEWIYKDLEKKENDRHSNGISCEDDELAKKMTLVGLWCIQTSPLDRPSMNKVVEMMEGSVDALEIPPRPVFQIPPTTLRESSTFADDLSGYTEVCSMNVTLKKETSFEPMKL